MVKRVLFVAIVLAAILVVAAPALAFNGYRDDYNVSSDCAICHTDTPGIPQVYNMWSETAHSQAGSHGQASRMPYGSSCGGCHSANYDPSKAIPTPTATPTTGIVSWGVTNGVPDTAAQATGNSVASELAVGCSSCHYNKTAAHSAPQSNLANAQICGQCHSRYSYTAGTYAVPAVPYAKVTLPLPGTPITPNPSPTTLLQPQYAIGLKTMGDAANGWTPQALSEKLIVQTPGWTPSPDPQATKSPGLMHYWQIDGKDTVWQYNGHDGSASQYPEWANEGHQSALEDLKAVMGPNPPAECLECHSADYIIAPEDGKPTGAEAKYGITCVGCHKPHERGTATGAWDEEWTPQLRTDNIRTICTTCHNAELDGKVAKPGSTVHHPMKEMMDGVGAIGVPQGSPSVHRGKCVQCHMPPTSTSPTGANHTFKIIEPEMAAEAKPHPDITTTPTPTMPFSACTTCHSRTGDTPALWLQDTLTDRQEAMTRWNDQVTAALTKAAKRLGFKSTAAANTAINKIKMSKWSKGQMTFQKAFTNQSYVVAEGSWGIHNWEYARTIILTALSQANSVRK